MSSILTQKDQIGKTTEDKKALAAGDNFIRKITEAVAPILPITLTRKKHYSGCSGKAPGGGVFIFASLNQISKKYFVL